MYDRRTMKIHFQLDPDQYDAFVASLDYYYGDGGSGPNIQGYLSGAVNAIIQAAAKGESITGPLQIVTCGTNYELTV